MPKRRSWKKDACPVARSVDVIGDRWALLIVRDAFDGISRFGDFQRSLGVAKNILATRLQSLTEEGILKQVPAADGSSYQEYALTTKGRSLFPVVVAMRQWGENHLFRTGEKHSVLLELATGAPLAPLQPSNAKGHVVVSEETVVQKVAAR